MPLMIRFVSALLMCSCGLDENGQLVTTDASTLEASTDVVIADVVSEPGPPLPCSTDASACTVALPTGWTPIAFETGRALACPSNFTTAEIVTNPQVQAGACTCDCKTVTQPSCSIGALTGTFGNTNQCAAGNNGPYNITADGQCFDWGGSFGLVPYHDWNKLGLTAGTCASSATPDPNKLTVDIARACVPSAQCTEDVCSGTVPAGFTSCIAAANDVACPPGPFTNRIGVFADAITVACGACSACTATGSGCGAATVDYYASANCTTSLATDAVNGTCTFSANGVTNVSHFKYTGTVLNSACTSGTSIATPNVTGTRTLCCRP